MDIELKKLFFEIIYGIKKQKRKMIMSSLHLSIANITFGLKIHKEPSIKKINLVFLKSEMDWNIKEEIKILPNQIASSTFKPVNEKINDIEGLLFILPIGSKGFLTE